MKGAIKILLVALCVCVVFTSPAFADKGRNEKCCKGAMGMQGKMKMEDKKGLEEKFNHKIHLILANSQELAVTDAQMEKITALKLKVKKVMLLKGAEIEVLALDIMDALAKDAVDMKIVNGLIDKKYEAKKQQAKELADAYVNLRMVLTPDQQKVLKEIWKNMMADKMKLMMCDDDDNQGMCCPMMGGMKKMMDMKMDMKKKPE